MIGKMKIQSANKCCCSSFLFQLSLSVEWDKYNVFGSNGKKKRKQKQIVIY